MEDRDILPKFQGPTSRNVAFNRFVRKYQGKVYWHARKVAEDYADDLAR